MASQSALINVMQKACIYASKGLLRDFGEVENLQVSRKGPGDFVSRADVNAEKVIRRELSKARSGGVNQLIGQISREASQHLFRVGAFLQHFERFIELGLL